MRAPAAGMQAAVKQFARWWPTAAVCAGFIATLALFAATADARCRTKACHQRVHDARVEAWLKRERPAVFYWRQEPPSWRQWARSTAQCESGNRPHVNTGNSYYGWLQFLPRTWFSAMRYAPAQLRTSRLPHLVRAEHQGVVAIRFAKVHGQGHWPVCGA